jgi:hypothetical protein
LLINSAALSAEKKEMNYLLLIALSLPLYASDDGFIGKVASVEGCSKKVMVWLSLDKELYKERLLLMHTEVPVGGSYQFYLKPGEYQVRASDEQGCEFFQRVRVSRGISSVNIQMVKK